MNTYDVVVGATRKSLTIPITDAQDAVIPLTGATAKLIGWSADLPGVGIDLAGTITNGPGGEVTFYSIGSLVDTVVLGAKQEATFLCRVEWQDLDGKDFTEELALHFIRLRDSSYVLNGGQLVESGHPFEFPMPTGAGRIRHAGPVVRVNFTNGERVVLLSRPAGSSGVVRDISWIVSSNTAPIALVLEVTVDGEASPAISVPLFTTVGVERPLSLLADIKVSTPAFEFSGGPFQPFAHFRLPIPYSDGVEVAIVAPAGAALNTMWANVIYQDGLPPCWNSQLRLRSFRTDELTPARTLLSGTTQLTDATHLLATATLPADIAGCAVSSTYCPNDMHVIQRIDDTHALVSSKDTALASIGVPGGTSRYYMHEWLNRPAGKAGWLAMVVAALSNNATDILYTLEGNVRIVLDQNAEADLTWTSIEDMFNGAYYFAVPVQFQDGGVMCLDTPAGNYSLYKLFKEFPVRYGDGVRGLVPLWAPVQTRCNWTTFFYEFSA